MYLFNKRHWTWEGCDLIKVKESFVLISAGFLVFSELADDQFGKRFHGAALCLVKWIVLIQRVQRGDSLKCEPAAWLSKLFSIVITVDKVFKDEYRQSKVEVCVLLWLAQRQRIQHLISHFGNWTVKVYHYKIFSKLLYVKKTGSRTSNFLTNKTIKINILFYLYGLVWKCLLVRRLVRYPAVNPSIPGVQIQFLWDNKHYKNYVKTHIFSQKLLFTLWSSQVQFARHISRAEAPTIQSGLGPSMLTTDTRWFLNKAGKNKNKTKVGVLFLISKFLPLCAVVKAEW